MMTKSDAKALMLRWLDEATSNGQPASADQIADLRDRADYLLDGVLKYLAGQFKLPAVHSIVRTPMENLINDGFAVRPIMPPDTLTLAAQGGRAFYIEVAGDDVVLTISDGNGVLREEEVTSASFHAIKGNLDTSGDVTLALTSQYPFTVRNIAIYPCKFASDEAVPDYTPYVPYELPEDFREFVQCVQTSDAHTYRKYSDLRKEGTRTFLLPYEASGQFDFHYNRNPQTVPPDAPETTVLEVLDHAAQLVPLKLAVDCCMGVDDTMTIGYYLDGRFSNMLMNLMSSDVGDILAIDTVYSML